MWLFAMFDLPVDTRLRRRRHAAFRKALQKRGFSMLQYSVYARYFASEDAARLERGRLRGLLPPEGHVRLLTVTDRQFGKMEVYFGETARQAERPPQQVTLF